MPRTPFVALALVGCLYAIRTLRKPIKAAPPINPILAQNRALLAEGGKGFIRTEHIEGLLDPSAPLNEFLNHKRSARLVRLGEVQVMHYPECSGSIILKKFSSLEEAQRSAARLLKASTPRHIVQKMTQTGNETYLLFLARDSLPW